MSRVKSTVKAAKNLADRANLRTGLAVTKAGPATTRRVRKRGRNVNVAAGAGAAGAGGAAGASLFSGDKKKSGSGGKRLAPGAGVRRPGSDAESMTKRFEQDTRDLGAANIRLNKKKTWRDVKSVAAAKKAGLKHYTGSDGKKKLAITKEELGRKKGETLTEAYNRAEGKKPRKSSTTAAKKPAAKKKVGGIRKFLLGDDGKFGGARGAIDFLPGKSRKKKPVKKAGGGMMKSKMASKGGARGGKKFPDMTGDGKVTQKDILKGRGVPGFSKGDLVVNMVRELSKLGRTAFKKEYGTAALNKAIKDTNKASGLTPTKAKKTPTQKKLAEADRRAEETKYTRQTPAAKKQRQVRASEKRMERMKNGGMAKKGYAKGGMAKKGYSKGGAVSRKPRGVGVALRGYGKALK